MEKPPSNNTENFDVDPVERPADRNPLIVVVAFILVLLLPYIYSKIEQLVTVKDVLEESRTRDAAREAARETYRKQSAEIEKTGKQSKVIEIVREKKDITTKTRKPGPGDIIIYDISILHDGFSPVLMKGPATSLPLNVQLETTPQDKIREPEYSGHEQWYGFLDLGNRQDKRFHLVLDLQKNNKFLMYFDKNNNKDLTDDGKPLENNGSGSGGPDGFATTISIPWKTLIREVPFDDDFKIWFFVNRAGWDNGNQASHYSLTQLAKTIQIDGSYYLALLVDNGYNDGDLSNDGIVIDLNRNDRVDQGERPALTHVINGLNYEFTVHW